MSIFFKLTPKNELAKITIPIPRLIKIDAKITAKYVFKIKAYINNTTVPGQGISPAVKTKYKSCFIKFGFNFVVVFGFSLLQEEVEEDVVGEQQELQEHDL